MYITDSRNSAQKRGRDWNGSEYNPITVISEHGKEVCFHYSEENNPACWVTTAAPAPCRQWAS